MRLTRCIVPPQPSDSRETATLFTKSGSAISRATVNVEIAEAGISALERELEALYAARREARIAADLAQAHRLAEKERRLIDVYAEAAARAAEALVELGPVHREMSILNANLPVRVEPVGTHLVHAAKLPGVAQGDGLLWPPRYRIPSLKDEESIK
jgi:hypothetical protein